MFHSHSSLYTQCVVVSTKISHSVEEDSIQELLKAVHTHSAVSDGSFLVMAVHIPLFHSDKYMQDRFDIEHEQNQQV